MEINTLDQALKLKEQGNDTFKSANYTQSIKFYTKAINLLDDNESKEMAILLKNRAAAYLKLNDNESALSDCNRALISQPNDPKTLFRRCQAYENLERYEEAYRDAVALLKTDPANSALVQPILKRLHRIVEERAADNARVSTKFDTMSRMAFDPKEERAKRQTAMTNLLVLARQGGVTIAEIMLHGGLVDQIKQLAKLELRRNDANNDDDDLLLLNAIRIIGELCKLLQNVEQIKQLLNKIGVPWFLDILDSNNSKQVNAVQYCIQAILNNFAGLSHNDTNSKPKQELLDKYRVEIDTIMTCLVCSINNRTISGLARDAIIELIMKNVDCNALNWAEKFVDGDGIARLMDCTSELQTNEYHLECAMNITQSTRTIAAVCLARIYDNMYYDAARTKYLNKIEDFIKAKLLSPDLESKIRVVVALTSLLKGPLDVGNAILGKDGVIEMILVMANCDDDANDNLIQLQQKVAIECIIAAVSKADKAKAIITQGINILKKLYQSKNDGIRVRALVGLCKLGSSGGNDATLKPFADGSNLKLLEACRRFLLNSKKDQDLRKWSAEGLSYLTLDAEVKEKLSEDSAMLRSLIDLASTGDQSCLFGIITTLVNLCNAYEKQEMLPEMIELARFAKQHIPEEHELDDADFVAKRIQTIAHLNVTTALVALSRTESASSRELISRVFNALCSQQELRGLVVQQGGVRVLTKLAYTTRTTTENGRKQAAQALARIAITINPEVAFPGQRALEVIRPLVSLLHPDCNGLENFEALMGLCNLAQLSETARKRILDEGGLAKIEHYMFEDHQHLCRAATQCLTNMTMSEDVVAIYAGDNDKIKYLLSLVMEEDVDTAMAAGGALAILTHASARCCEKLFDSKNWLDSFHCLLANGVVDLQYRGVCIVRNVVEQSKECTEKLMDSDVMEILMALTTKVPDVNNGGGGKVGAAIVTVANDALKVAEKWGVIKKAPTDSSSSGSSNSNGNVKIIELNGDEEE